MVFEGIDGSGKSTQARRLAGRIKASGRRVHSTAEPTASLIGSLIRNAFSGRVSMDDRTIAALFVADRLDHLTNEVDGILKFLNEGVTVVCDRYHLSSHAYHAADVGDSWVEQANSLSTKLLRPDLTVFLDIDPETALRRVESSRMVLDRFEREARLECASKSYLAAIQRSRTSDNVVVLSAVDSVDVTSEAVWGLYQEIASKFCD